MSGGKRPPASSVGSDEVEEIDAGTSARVRMPAPGAAASVATAVGWASTVPLVPLAAAAPVLNAAAQSYAQAGALLPLEIHLDLAELIELNEVVQHQKSGLIKKGQGFAKDPQRPAKVLAVVTKLFGALGSGVRISLGSGKGSQRFLKAAFTWGMDPDIGGVSAKGVTRTKMGPFNRMGDDQSRPVTAYVFEGVVGNWVVEYLGGSCNIDNLFATVIAHELGHQLGLDHTPSTGNIMFNFRDGSRADRIKWLQAGSRGSAGFDTGQVGVMRELLKKP